MEEDRALFVIGIGFVVNSVVCLFGNSLTLVCIKKNRKLHTSLFFYIASMAISDMTSTVIYSVISYYIISGKIADVDTVTCATLAGIGMFPLWNSVAHLMTVTSQKWIAVMFPLRLSDIIKPYVQPLTLVLDWSVALVISTMPVYWNTGMSSPCGLVSIYNLGYSIGFIIIPYFAVIVLMAVFYGQIFHEIRRQEKRHARDDVTGRLTSSEKRSAMMLSAALLALLVTQLPCIIVICMQLFGHSFSLVTQIACLLSSCLNFSMNFVIYALMSPTVRATMESVLCRQPLNTDQSEMRLPPRLQNVKADLPNITIIPLDPHNVKSDEPDITIISHPINLETGEPNISIISHSQNVQTDRPNNTILSPPHIVKID